MRKGCRQEEKGAKPRGREQAMAGSFMQGRWDVEPDHDGAAELLNEARHLARRALQVSVCAVQSPLRQSEGLNLPFRFAEWFTPLGPPLQEQSRGSRLRSHYTIVSL
jgi:hypothetical protein